MPPPRTSASDPPPARRLAALIPREQLHPRVLAWAERRPGRERWAVALSGGADSVALLLLLRAHFPRRRLVVLHFDHRLRGAQSAADARFCRQLARACGVGFVAGRWQRRPRAGRAIPGEAAARRARHDFFARAMARRRLRVLWLGHQQDDIAETMLMRLARGSGAGGLAAPRPVQAQSGGRVFVRPLLSLPKAQLQDALRKAGAAWCEDATNASADFFRNRIRRRVVPAWVAAARRDAPAGAAWSRELLEEDDAALEACVDRLRPIDAAARLDLARLAGEPRAIVRRALHRWLLKVRPESDLSRHGFAQLLDRLEAGGPVRFSLGARGFAVARGGKLLFERTSRPRERS